MFKGIRKSLIGLMLLVCMAVNISLPYNVCAQVLSGGNAITSMSVTQAGNVVSLPYLKGIRLYKDNPFVFDFMISENKGQLSDAAFKQEADKLIKYFLASVTVPENDLWVNLSPYEPDRIAPREFAQSAMGAEMLAQDYILKQLSASLTNPNTELGKQYWNTTNAGSNNLNRVWIVPAKAVIYAGADSAVIGETKLKVKCDDLRMQNILPAIEKQVNEGREFASLRQIYSAVILSSWYKNKLRKSIEQNILKEAYLDKKKVQGVNLSDKDAKDKIYQQYLKAFKQGAYNIVRSERTLNKITKRTYFSGGANLGATAGVMNVQPESATPASVVEQEKTSAVVTAGTVDARSTIASGDADNSRLFFASRVQHERFHADTHIVSALDDLANNLFAQRADGIWQWKFDELMTRYNSDVAYGYPGDKYVYYAGGRYDWMVVVSTDFKASHIGRKRKTIFARNQAEAEYELGRANALLEWVEREFPYYKDKVTKRAGVEGYDSSWVERVDGWKKENPSKATLELTQSCNNAGVLARQKYEALQAHLGRVEQMVQTMVSAIPEGQAQGIDKDGITSKVRAALYGAPPLRQSLEKDLALCVKSKAKAQLLFRFMSWGTGAWDSSSIKGLRWLGGILEGSRVDMENAGLIAKTLWYEADFYRQYPQGVGSFIGLQAILFGSITGNTLDVTAKMGMSAAQKRKIYEELIYLFKYMMTDEQGRVREGYPYVWVNCNFVERILGKYFESGKLRDEYKEKPLDEVIKLFIQDAESWIYGGAEQLFDKGDPAETEESLVVSGEGTRVTSQDAHDAYNFDIATVLRNLAEKLKIPRVNEKYDFMSAVEKAGGFLWVDADTYIRTENISGNYAQGLKDKTILVFISPKFGKSHLGPQHGNVYAVSEAKAAHELAEHSFLVEYALEHKVITASQYNGYDWFNILNRYLAALPLDEARDVAGKCEAAGQAAEAKYISPSAVLSKSNLNKVFDFETYIRRGCDNMRELSLMLSRAKKVVKIMLDAGNHKMNDTYAKMGQFLAGKNPDFLLDSDIYRRYALLKLLADVDDEAFASLQSCGLTVFVNGLVGQIPDHDGGFAAMRELVSFADADKLVARTLAVCCFRKQESDFGKTLEGDLEQLIVKGLLPANCPDKVKTVRRDRDTQLDAAIHPDARKYQKKLALASLSEPTGVEDFSLIVSGDADKEVGGVSMKEQEMNAVIETRSSNGWGSASKAPEFHFDLDLNNFNGLTPVILKIIRVAVRM